LTIYREVPASMSRAGLNPFREKVVMISAENVAAAVGQTTPSRLHWDISALVHGLHEKVSARPDLNAMCSVLRDAASRIAGGVDCDVQRRLADRIASLRHQHFIYLSGMSRLPGVGSFAGRAFGAIRRRLSRMH
jgi:hypothetical protein